MTKAQFAEWEGWNPTYICPDTGNTAVPWGHEAGGYTREAWMRLRRFATMTVGASVAGVAPFEIEFRDVWLPSVRQLGMPSINNNGVRLRWTGHVADSGSIVDATIYYPGYVNGDSARFDKFGAGSAFPLMPSASGFALSPEGAPVVTMQTPDPYPDPYPVAGPLWKDGYPHGNLYRFRFDPPA